MTSLLVVAAFVAFWQRSCEFTVYKSSYALVWEPHRLFAFCFQISRIFLKIFHFGMYVRTTSCCYCCWPLIGTAGVCMWRVSPLSRSGSPHYYVETTCEDYEQLRNSDSDNDNNTTTQQRNTIIVAVVVVVCSSKLIFVTKLIFIVFLILFKFQLRLAL